MRPPARRPRSARDGRCSAFRTTHPRLEGHSVSRVQTCSESARPRCRHRRARRSPASASSTDCACRATTAPAVGSARATPRLHPLQGDGLVHVRPGGALLRGVRARRPGAGLARCATASTPRCASAAPTPAAPLKNEADCLARQLRRTSGAANYLDLTRSKYRASGLVLRPRADVGEDWSR